MSDEVPMPYRPRPGRPGPGGGWRAMWRDGWRVFTHPDFGPATVPPAGGQESPRNPVSV